MKTGEKGTVRKKSQCRFRSSRTRGGEGQGSDNSRAVVPQEYASSEDFRRVFQEHLSSLHRLSFLLTADPKLAEDCVLAALEECVNNPFVFREWAHSWARRAIVQSAVRRVAPSPEGELQVQASSSVPVQFSPPDTAASSFAQVLELQPFERFVFVVSVLELYSDQDCSILLGASRRDVSRARRQALQHLPPDQFPLVELHRPQPFPWSYPSAG